MAVFEILLKDIAIKSLVLQLKVIKFVIVYVGICARENVPIYCNKATGADMHNDTVARVKQYISM